nr:hypothetical protein [Tanacetum cinerariifolium]
MSELKTIDHSSKALVVLQSHVPIVVDSYLDTKDSGDADVSSLLDIPIQYKTPQTQSPSVQKIHVSMILMTTNLPPIPKNVTETPVSNAVLSPQVTPIFSSLQQTPTPIPTPPITIDALTITTAVLESNALTVVELRVAKLEKDHDDDEDDDNKDPLAGPNQGKKNKRRRTKEFESLKKPSFTKETLKGKTPIKGSKAGKSASAKEPIEEPITEVIIDDAGNDLVRDDDQPQATTKPKTSKTLNLKWFKQPPRPPTPDPEWNKQVTYTTSITKTKDARYDIKGIKDMVPTLWSTIKHAYDKDASMGIRHWVKDVNCDMLLLAIQHKLFHLDGSDIFDFIVALRMFTRSVILKRCVEELQLGVESYHKKLNITKPHNTFPEIEFKEPYTPSYDPSGIVYEDLDKQKRVCELMSCTSSRIAQLSLFELRFITEYSTFVWITTQRCQRGSGRLLTERDQVL